MQGFINTDKGRAMKKVSCEPLTAEKFLELVEKARLEREKFSWKEFAKTLPTIEQTNPGHIERIRRIIKENK